jgi:hypothetical protein
VALPEIPAHKAVILYSARLPQPAVAAVLETIPQTPKLEVLEVLEAAAARGIINL